MQNERGMKTISYLCILCAASLWGAIGISVRYIAKFGINSIQSACFRIFITTITLFLVIFVVDRKKFRVKREDFKLFFGSGVVSILLNNVCYAISVQINSLSTAATLLYTAPFIVVLLAYVVFHERLTVSKISALFICFIGCILSVGIGVFTGTNLQLYGILAGLGSALGYALYNIFTKVLVKKYDILTVEFYTFLFALVGALFISSPQDAIPKIIEHQQKIPFAVFSTIITSATPYFIFPIALRHVESGKASIIATFEVAASTLLGIFLYHEKLELMNVVGIIMIVIAIVTLNATENTRKT